MKHPSSVEGVYLQSLCGTHFWNYLSKEKVYPGKLLTDVLFHLDLKRDIQQSGDYSSAEWEQVADASLWLERRNGEIFLSTGYSHDQYLLGSLVRNHWKPLTEVMTPQHKSQGVCQCLGLLTLELLCLACPVLQRSLYARLQTWVWRPKEYQGMLVFGPAPWGKKEWGPKVTPKLVRTWNEGIGQNVSFLMNEARLWV